MSTAKLLPRWKDVGLLEFMGIVLLIPISFIVFNIVIGFMFRGSLQSNPETTFKMLLKAFYLCLGCGIAPYIYRFRKCYLIILCSCVGLFLFQVLIAVPMKPDAHGVVIGIIGNTLPQVVWVCLPLTLCVFIFRYSEARLDFAEVKDILEKTDKETNKKYSQGICTKCGAVTIVSSERESPGRNKIEFFCDNCGRFVRGNPLPNMVIGLVLIAIAMLFLYGRNSNGQDSLISAFNLLFLIVLYVGAKTFYASLRWTLHTASKSRNRILG